MSIADIERFAADLKNDATLRAEAEKAFTASSAMSAERVIGFAGARGYSFTASELNEQAKTRAGGKTVSDAELDAVSGGFLPSNDPISMMLSSMMMMAAMAPSRSS
jgi:predicted ribosomally synthesized peptide with nif11-like leader